MNYLYFLRPHKDFPTYDIRNGLFVSQQAIKTNISWKICCRIELLLSNMKKEGQLLRSKELPGPRTRKKSQWK